MAKMGGQEVRGQLESAPAAMYSRAGQGRTLPCPYTTLMPMAGVGKVAYIASFHVARLQHRLYMARTTELTYGFGLAWHACPPSPDMVVLQFTTSDLGAVLEADPDISPLLDRRWVQNTSGRFGACMPATVDLDVATWYEFFKTVTMTVTGHWGTAADQVARAAVTLFCGMLANCLFV